MPFKVYPLASFIIFSAECKVKDRQLPGISIERLLENFIKLNIFLSKYMKTLFNVSCHLARVSSFHVSGRAIIVCSLKLGTPVCTETVGSTCINEQMHVPLAWIAPTQVQNRVVHILSCWICCQVYQTDGLFLERWPNF